MICGLMGELVYKGRAWGEVEVSGVFYRVMLPRKLLEKLNVGSQVKLSTYMHVTEDDMSLYGFESREEVDMFRMLIGVSGVGPKSGVLIFDDNGLEEIRRAVIEADVDFFKKVKGLGLKTAQKIIIELKTKIGSMRELDLSGSDEKDSKLKEDEIYLGLLQLGFDRKNVVEIIKKIPKEKKTTEDRLEWCLKSI